MASCRLISLMGVFCRVSRDTVLDQHLDTNYIKVLSLRFSCILCLDLSVELTVSCDEATEDDSEIFL